MNDRFDKKVALVTGAGSGIGLAAANRLASEGATVVACIVHDDQREAVKGFDSQLLDVRSETDWDRVLAQLETTHGSPDVLINNAGVHLVANAEETTRETWMQVMDVNLWGTFLGCKKVIPYMRKAGGGAIVNLSSFAAIRGVPRQVAYATTKGAILTMTLALAADHVSDRIRVNCVCPGATQTPIIDGLTARQSAPKEFRADLEAKTPMGKMAEPEEVAAAIAYLASDDASHTTGIALPVDGGRSSR